MRAGAEPEIDDRPAQVGGQVLGRCQRPPGDVVGKARRRVVAQPAAQSRPQAVGDDERGAPRLGRAARGGAGDGDAVAICREVLDADAEMQPDIRMRQCGFEQRGLQVGAMDDPVRRAVTLRDRCPERRTRQHPAAGHAPDDQFLGGDDVRAQPVAQSQRQQDARRIGGELDAGAGFLQPCGLLSRSRRGNRCGRGRGRR